MRRGVWLPRVYIQQATTFTGVQGLVERGACAPCSFDGADRECIFIFHFEPKTLWTKKHIKLYAFDMLNAISLGTLMTPLLWPQNWYSSLVLQHIAPRNPVKYFSANNDKIKLMCSALSPKFIHFIFIFIKNFRNTRKPPLFSRI